MPHHKNISCHLYIGDSAAAEYNVKNAGNVSTTHIVSKEDEAFSFKINADTAQMGASRLDLELWADGNRLDCFTFTETNYEVDDAQVRDQATGAIKIVKLRFAKLKTVNECTSGADAAEAERLKRLGTLELKLWRSQAAASHSTAYNYQPCPSQAPVNEKEIKGQSVSHVTSLKSNGTIAQPSSWGYITRKIDPYETPWVTFVFKHASKELLQAESIVPKDKVMDKPTTKAQTGGEKVSQKSKPKSDDTKNDEIKVKVEELDDDIAAMPPPQIQQEIMRSKKKRTHGSAYSNDRRVKARTTKNADVPDQTTVSSTTLENDDGNEDDIMRFLMDTYKAKAREHKSG
ncbi:hypothetical protein ABW21_db0202115 [Orbilia brochopaga]|nr:hypothetical protein ABW21_db0202115 [Drechslerella brochopaga]